MYGGHIALGIAAKRWIPAVPLGILIVASQLPDWIDVLVCTTRSGTSNPTMLTHSIPAVALFATVGALTGRFVYGSWYVARILALLIVSHMLGDYITGFKPTWPGGPLIGLRLYGRPMLDFLFESVVIVWSWWMYRSTFRPAYRSSFAVRGMLIGLIALQAVADIAFGLGPRIAKCG